MTTESYYGASPVIVLVNDQGPVVQRIVSLTASLRHQLVKYIYADYIIKCTVIFLFVKCENLLHCKRFSHFSNKKY